MSYAKRRLDDALAERYPEPPEQTVKHYVFVVKNNEPFLYGPYTNRVERDGDAKSIFNGPDFSFSHISWLDVAPDGTPNVGIYTDEDLAIA